MFSRHLDIQNEVDSACTAHIESYHKSKIKAHNEYLQTDFLFLSRTLLSLAPLLSSSLAFASPSGGLVGRPNSSLRFIAFNQKLISSLKRL